MYQLGVRIMGFLATEDPSWIKTSKGKILRKGAPVRRRKVRKLEGIR